MSIASRGRGRLAAPILFFIEKYLYASAEEWAYLETNRPGVPWPCPLDVQSTKSCSYGGSCDLCASTTSRRERTSHTDGGLGIPALRLVINGWASQLQC